MLPPQIREKTIFIGNSTSITSMIQDSVSLKNKQIIKKAFLKEPPQLVYLHNFHFLNQYIAKMTRKNQGRFVYHVHEPYVKNKKAHGGFHQYWLNLFEFFQARLLNHTDVAIVSSKEASSLFNFRYPSFQGKKMEIPLLYEDLGESDMDANARQFITFVGPPVPAKNPEKFIEIIKYSENKNLNLQFLLISRDEIKTSEYDALDNLKVISQKRLSDQEFGKLIKQSIAVITPYKRETQSSVILTSYMYGTPIISSNVGGLPEFVSDGKTGYLLSPEDDAAEWVKRIFLIRESFQAFSDSSRAYFVQNFSGLNWKTYLYMLLG